MTDSITGRTREIIRNADRVLTVDEITDALVDVFRDQWTEEENLRYRIGNIVRQCMNSEDWYSILRNTYTNYETADPETQKIIMEKQKEKIVAHMQSYCRKKNMVGQLTFRFFNDGSYEVVESWAY